MPVKFVLMYDYAMEVTYIMANLQKTGFKYLMAVTIAAQLSACSSVTLVHHDDLTELEKMEQARKNTNRQEKRDALCENTVDDGSKERGKIIRKNCKR